MADPEPPPSDPQPVQDSTFDTSHFLELPNEILEMIAKNLDIFDLQRLRNSSQATQQRIANPDRTFPFIKDLRPPNRHLSHGLLTCADCRKPIINPEAFLWFDAAKLYLRTRFWDTMVNQSRGVMPDEDPVKTPRTFELNTNLVCDHWNTNKICSWRKLDRSQAAGEIKPDPRRLGPYPISSFSRGKFGYLEHANYHENLVKKQRAQRQKQTALLPSGRLKRYATCDIIFKCYDCNDLCVVLHGTKSAKLIRSRKLNAKKRVCSDCARSRKTELAKKAAAKEAAKEAAREAAQADYSD